MKKLQMIVMTAQDYTRKQAIIRVDEWTSCADSGNGCYFEGT